jgi:hypothetical protein
MTLPFWRKSSGRRTAGKSFPRLGFWSVVEESTDRSIDHPPIELPVWFCEDVDQIRPRSCEFVVNVPGRGDLDGATLSGDTPDVEGEDVAEEVGVERLELSATRQRSHFWIIPRPYWNAGQDLRRRLGSACDHDAGELHPRNTLIGCHMGDLLDRDEPTHHVPTIILFGPLLAKVRRHAEKHHGIVLWRVLLGIQPSDDSKALAIVDL